MPIDQDSKRDLLQRLNDVQERLDDAVDALDLARTEMTAARHVGGALVDFLASIPVIGSTPPPDPDPEPEPEPGPVTRKPFRVFARSNGKRNLILDPTGKPFHAMGCNWGEFWGATYLDKYTPVGLPDLRKRSIAHVDRVGCNAVRIVAQTDQQRTAWAWNSSPAAQRQLVKLAFDLGIVPMLELHDSTTDRANNPHGFMDPAIPAYWLSDAMVRLCLDYPEMWINIANEANFKRTEALTDQHRALWASWYADFIPKLRAKGVKNLIVVDSGGTFAQDHRFILTHAEQIQDADPERNCVFSWHMYQFWTKTPARWPVGQFNPNVEIPALGNLNVPVILGEFGWHNPQHADVAYNSQEVFELCEKHGIGTFFWSWFDGKDRFNIPVDLVSINAGLGSDQLTAAGEWLVPYWSSRRTERRAVMGLSA